MRNDRSFTDFERDLGRRKPSAHHGTPWIGTELDRSGESIAAFPGTGTSLPQDIGADGFEVEPLVDEPRDDLSLIDTEEEEVNPKGEFGASDLDMTPSMDGAESLLLTLDPQRLSRVRRIEEAETELDKKGGSEEMGESAELSELPIGSEDTSAGELGRYECPNCGFEYDVVVGAAARCPACNYEADLSSIIGDEAFHHSFSATDLEE